jgi:hypothetical protein
MPTTTGQQIVDRARLVLQDASGVRYLDAHGLTWTNEGQVALFNMRHDINPVRETLTLVDGSEQTIPAAAVRLGDVLYNVESGAARRAIRRVSLGLLDSQRPLFHRQTRKAVITDWAQDPRFPRTYYVYPPAVAGTQVKTVYYAPPTALGSLASVISIDDQYAPTLVNYLLYRFFSQENEVGLAEKAVMFYRAVENDMGVLASADAASEDSMS